MILILDAGGSKTDWRHLCFDGSIEQGKTSGFNPFIQGIEECQTMVSHLKDSISKPVSKIYYYGAGCHTQQQKEAISNCFLAHFNGAAMDVNDDLLGTARSLCGKEPGIACILGTGANSCHFDGNRIVQHVQSLGYALGDEGSGATMGKMILKSFCREEMPDELMDSFRKRYNMDVSEILDNLYRKPRPNKFLGGFTRFAFHHLNDPFIYKLVYGVFEEFLKDVLIKYDQLNTLPIHFSGSIAFYFSNILRQMGTDNNLNISKIVETPIAGLTLYHQPEIELLLNK
ncbi:MAG: N-acetylglucosamine kinase [Bacteroidetes bacterium]|nr:N-acetylglucosamine kinase [Bacteroidota bacterium]MDA1120391.1 N-acetylglucosamine kinase [Bacteroidota bacterium]